MIGAVSKFHRFATRGEHFSHVLCSHAFSSSFSSSHPSHLSHSSLSSHYLFPFPLSNPSITSLPISPPPPPLSLSTLSPSLPLSPSPPFPSYLSLSPPLSPLYLSLRLSIKFFKHNKEFFGDTLPFISELKFLPFSNYTNLANFIDLKNR